MDIRSFSKEEQETTITFQRDDNHIQVYSSDRTMITKLKKVTENITVLSVDKNGEITSCKCELDRKQLSFRTKKIELSEKERLRRAERMREIHSKL